MRRTKIVCTLGPATNDVETMKKLIKSGLDAARINFSHGTYESHGETIAKLKQAREEMDAPIPLILDTKGPEIRIRTFAEGKIHLEVGDKFTLTTKEVEGDRNMVSVTYKDMPNDLQRGSRVLLDDGLIELQVESVEAEDIHCVVVNGGNLSSNKGVNIPGIKVNLPSLQTPVHTFPDGKGYFRFEIRCGKWFRYCSGILYPPCCGRNKYPQNSGGFRRRKYTDYF